MRCLLTCLTLLAVGPLGAMEVYRWVDKDGVVHFSDQPTEGAQKIPLKGAPRPGSVAPANTPVNTAESEGSRPAVEAFRYSACSISSPAQDETFSSPDAVGVAIDLQPGFRQGDRIQVQLNGQRVQDWPESSTSYLLTALPRGSYTLSVTVLGPDGERMCTAAPVGFQVTQPSILTPGYKAAPHS